MSIEELHQVQVGEEIGTVFRTLPDQSRQAICTLAYGQAPRLSELCLHGARVYVGTDIEDRRKVNIAVAVERRGRGGVNRIGIDVRDEAIRDNIDVVKGVFRTVLSDIEEPLALHTELDPACSEVLPEPTLTALGFIHDADGTYRLAA